MVAVNRAVAHTDCEVRVCPSENRTPWRKSNIASDADFCSVHDKFLFVRAALEHDHCFAKPSLAPVCRPKETELHTLIEPLRVKFAHRANRLQADFEQIAAVGDVTDITRQVMEAGNLPTSPDDAG